MKSPITFIFAGSSTEYLKFCKIVDVIPETGRFKYLSDVEDISSSNFNVIMLGTWQDRPDKDAVLGKINEVRK